MQTIALGDTARLKPAEGLDRGPRGEIVNVHTTTSGKTWVFVKYGTEAVVWYELSELEIVRHVLSIPIGTPVRLADGRTGDVQAKDFRRGEYLIALYNPLEPFPRMTHWIARADVEPVPPAAKPAEGITAPQEAVWTEATELEWAVQSRTLVDGPFDRTDDGRGWSDRHGRPYNEAEARAEAARRNASWLTTARVVSRRVTEWRES